MKALLPPPPRLAALLACGLLLPPVHAQQPPVGPPPAADREVAEQERDIALGDFRRDAEDAVQGARVAVEHAVRLGRDFARNFRFEAIGQPRILVVPARGMEARRAAELREDLAVMHRILAGALPDGSDDPHRVEWFMGGGWGGPQALYLPGSGPVFLLEARIPLIGPPDKQAAGKAASDSDRVWEEARQELRGGPRREVWIKGGPEQPRYDELRVNDLRQRLTAVLKHARNIRGLGPSEKVTLVVTGPAAAVEGGSDDAAPPAPGTTVMTLIATAYDLAALARGDSPKLEAAFQ